MPTDTPQRLSRGKAMAFAALTVVAGISIVLALAEGVARMLDSRAAFTGGSVNTPDPELGWVPKPGVVHMEGPEFSVEHRINELGMSDDPVSRIEELDLRVLALGDSHTFAVGASTSETWPNVLESLLRESSGDSALSVFNLGAVGYSLGQYLVRFRQMKDVLKPHVVIVGFSMATDLYDLIPPSRGGFVYGAEYGRIYFDLDENGDLVEKPELVGRTISEEDLSQTRSMNLRIRGLLDRLALFRRLKRSRIAVWLATSFSPRGQWLWPGMDTALKRELDEEDQYRWQLAARLLQQLAAEAQEPGSAVVLVNIPYLAQVYDEIWSSSFGRQPEKYDRWIAGERLEVICREAGIRYIDTTPRFVEETRRLGRWLHYPRDAHPTPEGHQLIARTVASGLSELGLASVHRSTRAPATDAPDDAGDRATWDEERAQAMVTQ